MDRLRKPEWLKSNRLGAGKTQDMIKLISNNKLHTVCASAKCPNLGECFERGTATFMVLGDICTRKCTFCAVNKEVKSLQPPDSQEPFSIAQTVQKLKLKHVVLTTVTRDDLIDGGATHFAEIIKQIRKIDNSDVSIEVLTSDFNGNQDAVDIVISAHPDVFNHNIETIARLYPLVRPQADFQRSLSILRNVKNRNDQILTKSGFMVGLGESKTEVESLLKQLRASLVDIVTIGQYMAPTASHFPVKEYVHPDSFAYYRDFARDIGFKIVEAAPLVRSSYHAENARMLLARSKKKLQ
jgi:lipoic acid synthetase